MIVDPLGFPKPEGSFCAKLSPPTFYASSLRPVPRLQFPSAVLY